MRSSDTAELIADGHRRVEMSSNSTGLTERKTGLGFVRKRFITKGKRLSASAAAAIAALLTVGVLSAGAASGVAYSPAGGYLTIDVTCDSGFHTMIYTMQTIFPSNNPQLAYVTLDDWAGSTGYRPSSTYVPARTIVFGDINAPASGQHRVWVYVYWQRGTSWVPSVGGQWVEARYYQTAYMAYPRASNSCTV
jgi:hypothetical protein